MSTPNGHFGFGNPATAEQIAGWDIDVAADGTGLPPGSGTVQQGEEIYARLGAKCHGAMGEGGEGGPPLVGGIGSLEHRRPAEDGRQLLAIRAGPLTTTSIARCPRTNRSR